MSTDMHLVKRLRDMNPEALVTFQVDGVPTTPSTGAEFIEEHDIVVQEARKEGARIILQQMEDVLYTVEAAGGLDLLEKGESADWVRGFKEGMMTQLSSAKTALDGGLIDFNQEIRS